MRLRTLVSGCCCAAISALSTVATTAQPLPVQEMSFDLWCQEQAKLPPAECDKRTNSDEAIFEAYRDKVEQYEVPYLQQQLARARMDRDMLDNDPIDNPVTRDITANTAHSSGTVFDNNIRVR
jgi:hypothetical protein